MKLNLSLIGAGAALAALALLPSAAFAQVAQTTTVSIPIGEWLGMIQPFILEIVLLVFAFLCRQLPGYAVAMIKTFGVQQMLEKAVINGINSVAGADHKAALSVDVGNAVVAAAVQYVVKHAPAWLIDHAGGFEMIKDKILARITLEADAAIKNGVVVKGNLPKPAK